MKDKINMKLIILFLTAMLGSCSSLKTSYKADANISQNSITIDSVFVLDSIIVKEHLFKDLSYTHNFKITFFGLFKNGEEKEEEHYWEIIIYDKEMNVVDSIHQPIYWFYAESIDLNSYRSYITGINKDEQAFDNYYGDFIVADFNFDSKNDFAIINSMGGNGGPLYSYYIQQDDGKFVLDTFLTNSMIFFPTKIDSKNRRLTTYVHAGVCWIGEHIYKLNKTNKWKEIRRRIIDVCEKQTQNKSKKYKQ